MTLIGSNNGAELYFDPSTCDIAYKTADGIYCELNGHLYTWINLADGKMLNSLNLRFR